MNRDYVGWTWEDIQVHVEDDLRNGAFEMFQPVYTNEELKREYLVEPWQAGHLSQREADRLYRGQQIR